MKHRLGLALLIAGIVFLLAGALISVDRLIAVSPDGSLSFSLQDRIRGAQVLLALLGVLLATLGGALWRGTAAGGAAFVAGAAGLFLLMQQVYPGNLLSRPGKLLELALGQDIPLGDYQPKAHVTVPESAVLRARFPAINAHAHFRKSTKRTPEEILRIMDACNIALTLDLDGGMGNDLKEELARFPQAYPGRFAVLANFWFGSQITDWDRFASDVAKLDEAKADGAVGIKIWKNLGLWTRDENRRLIAIDDPRVDPLWAKAEALGLPILIHIADLQSNFEPLDRFNERFEFLKQNLDLAYQGPKAPSPLSLLEAFERVVDKHPNQTFILAHLGNRSDDLREAGAMLDRHPNLAMDLSARSQEMGRQPAAARAFLMKYPNRILFGTDGNPDEKILRGYFRLLETEDDYFRDPRWPQTRWRLYGIKLPDDVLRQVYFENAARLFHLKVAETADRQ